VLRNKNSYLLKIILYFMTVLLVPLCTIIVLNIQSQSVIKKQILLSNQNTLDQVFRLMDTVLTEMRDTCIEVSLRNELSQYARSLQDGMKGIAYERFELCQLLNTYMLDKYADLFVYFPQDGYIVSGKRGMLSAENYYRVYFDKAEGSEQDYWDNLNCGFGYPVLDVINAWSEDSRLCVSMRHTLESELGYCTITVIMDTKYLNELLYESNAGRGGELLLFDGREELILCGSKEQQPFDLKGYPGESVPYETQFKGEGYVMQIYPLEDLKGYCGYAIPAEYFWEQLAGMRLFSIVGIFACVILGIILVSATSRRAYAPVNAIVSKLRKDNDTVGLDSNNITEFEFLEEVFYSQKEKQQELYREVRGSIKSVRERFIFRLLNGEGIEEKQSDDAFEKNGITLCSDRFTAGVITLESGYENQNGIITFTMANVLEELFERVGKGYIVSLREGNYAFLLNQATNVSLEQVDEVLEEGMEFLEQHFKLKMTIGRSSVHEGLQGIGKAYQEAINALEYQFVLGRERIVGWELVADRSFSYLDSGQAMLPAILEDYLNQTEEAGAVAGFVADLFRRYRIDEAVSLETLECFKFDLINAVNRAALSSGMTAEERHQSVKQLLNPQTLEEMEQNLGQLLMNLRQKRLEQKSSGICEQARDYLEEHYSDSQLSVASLCDALSVSSSYLSRMYRSKYDTTVAQEITRIRLKKAKELLHDTDLSVNEIAEETGFSNGNVFIKVFKKWEGITPGRYRELL